MKRSSSPFSHPQTRASRRSRRRNPRRLILEALEDRTLLAVTVNQLLFPPLTEVGPRFNDGGQVESISNSTVAGAVSTIAIDPGNAIHVYIGTVNGGVWKTDDINAMTTFDPNRIADEA